MSRPVRSTPPAAAMSWLNRHRSCLLSAGLTGTVAVLALSSSLAAAEPVAGKDAIVFEGVATQQRQLPIYAARTATPPAVVPGNGTIDYAANRSIARIVVERENSDLIADGHSPAHVKVQVFGPDGAPVTGDVYLTVELGSDARLKAPDGAAEKWEGDAADLDRATPGTQIKVTGGSTAFDVLAPTTAGDVFLRVTGGAVEAAGNLSYTTEKRPLFAIGILEGILSKRHLNPGRINATNPNDGFEQDLQHWSHAFQNGTNVAGRAAFFAKGMIDKDVSLTVAYDSDKDLRARLMRDISPELYYPVRGDASIVGFDARSSGRGYVRLDRGRDYLMYGDFNTGDGFSQLTDGGAVTGLTVRRLGAYNRTVTGVRVHSENRRYLFNAFGTYDRLRQTVEQYPLNGTSILPFNNAQNAIVDSEKVEIVTYDKQLRTRIIDVKPLIRYQDYAFEPFNGRIRLLGGDVNFLDFNGNPRFIRVTYENDQDSTSSFFTFGSEAQITLSPNVKIGGSYNREENPLAPYTLYSANASIRLGPKTGIVAEYARSSTNAYVQRDGTTSTYSTGAAGETQSARKGDAWRVEFQHQSDGVRVNGYYEHVAPSFQNQSIGVANGQSTAGATAEVDLTETLSLYAEASRVEDRVTAHRPARDSEEAGLHWTPNSRLSLTGGIHHIHEDVGLTSQATLPGNYGGIFNPNGLMLSGANFGNPGLTNIANTTPIETVTARLAVDYKLTERFSVQGDVEQAISDAHHNRFALGGSYQLSERTRAYARYEDQTGLGSGLSLNQGDRSNALVVGFDSTYRSGSSVYSEYRLRDAASGQTLRAQDMQLASGVRRSWQASKGVQLSSNLEYLKILQGKSRDALGIGIGADFTGSSSWKGSTRVEFRRIFDDKIAPGDQRQDQYLATASLARKLNDDWTMLARNYFLFNKYRDNELGKPVGNIVQNRAQLGLAYRPVGDDRWAMLFRYDYKIYRDRATSDGIDYNAHISAVNVNWHPSRPLWFNGRIAGEIRHDRVPDAVTGGTQNSAFKALLVSGRVIYDLTDHIDLSVMGARTWSDQNGASDYAAGGEIGYLLAKDFWLSAGYNWSGFDNADLSGTEYHNRGGYIRMRVKFSGLLGD